MASLLKIDVSPRFEASISRALGEKFVDDWRAKNPDGTVVTRDLARNPLPFVDLGWVIGAYTDPATHGPEAQKSIGVSNELVDELLAATEIVITTPMYNFAPPSALKAWVDHVVRLNRTFNSKYEGLAGGRNVTVSVASAGTYTPDSGLQGMDFFTPYLRFILGFMGLNDVTFVVGDKTSAIEQGKISREDYVEAHPVAA